MIKCTPHKGGYAATVCNALSNVLEIQPTTRSKGLFTGSIVDIPSGKSLGNRIMLKSGEHGKVGIILNYCPFCAGELRELPKVFNREVYDKFLADDDETPLEFAISRAQTLYNKILKDAKVDHDNAVWHYGDLSDTQKDHIEIRWEVRWGFGGEADGDYNIPMTALFDDTWEASVRECAACAIKEYRR